MWFKGNLNANYTSHLKAIRIKAWGTPTKKFEGDLDLISTPKLLLEGGKGLGRMGHYCHHLKNNRNLNFGFVTKAKGLQGCEQGESPRVTSHTPGSVEKCEGVNPHTPNATPTLGDGVPVHF